MHFAHPDVLKFAGVDGVENKPKGIILSYPVITAEKGICHEGTIENFCAGRENLRETASLEKHVSPQTPPCFIDRADQPTVPRGVRAGRYRGPQQFVIRRLPT